MRTKKEKAISVGIVILKVIGVAGVISMAVLAPNALQSLRMFGLGKRRPYYGSDIDSAFGRLLRRKLIKIEKKGSKKFVRLTDGGKEQLLKYQLGTVKIKKPRKWDKKWRVIIFDVREHKRRLRDLLREELINLGFVKLQNSVWVYPYECEEISIMLKSQLRLGKEVVYMTVDKIENDNWLKKEFKIK